MIATIEIEPHHRKSWWVFFFLLVYWLWQMQMSCVYWCKIIILPDASKYVACIPCHIYDPIVMNNGRNFLCVFFFSFFFHFILECIYKWIVLVTHTDDMCANSVFPTCIMYSQKIKCSLHLSQSPFKWNK